MKKFFKSKTIQNLNLLICIVIISIGLVMSLFDNSIFSNVIIGIGIMLTGFNLMKLINQ